METAAFIAEWHNDSPTLLVHTSGSTGRPKPLWVEKRRMEASARITCRFLGLKAGDTALLCLPLDYIAGKMMVVRSLVCHLRLVSVAPSAHPLATVDTPLDFAAMVPMQVWNSLQVPAEAARLRQIRHLIIGGGAVDEALAGQLRDFPFHVWSTYGMTETLSHVALRRLNGPDASDWYTPFEQVRVSLSPDGCLVIDAPAVSAHPLTTNDIAVVDRGRFRILGRRDNVICSGGVKIQAEEVERLLSPHVRVPFIITRAPHPELGQQVVMLVEAADTGGLSAVCAAVLPRYWRPRRILAVSRLPLTATGKPARAEAERLAAQTV